MMILNLDSHLKLIATRVGAFNLHEKYIKINIIQTYYFTYTDYKIVFYHSFMMLQYDTNLVKVSLKLRCLNLMYVNNWTKRYIML